MIERINLAKLAAAKEPTLFMADRLNVVIAQLNSLTAHDVRDYKESDTIGYINKRIDEYKFGNGVVDREMVSVLKDVKDYILNWGGRT